jgi:hypothetical protein
MVGPAGPMRRTVAKGRSGSEIIGVGPRFPVVECLRMLEDRTLEDANEDASVRRPCPASDRLGVRRAGALCAAIVGLITASAFPQLADGFGDLSTRLGESAPTGQDVGLGFVEAGGTDADRYAPDLAAFPNRNILLMSGPSITSAHATQVLNTFVARAPGVVDVWSWEALDWLQGGFLNFGAGAPLSPPTGLRVFNHSWVAGNNDPAVDNDVMRRFDYQITRDGSIECVGTSNSLNATTPYILSSQFNGLTVGHPAGAHQDTIGGGRDGQGRMKPDLVASAGNSSNSAPRAAALASLLLETAATDPSVSANPDADDPQVIKAAILAGATHPDGWSNEPIVKGAVRGVTTRPLDFEWGAGYLNADRSHLILTGGEQPASTSVPVEPTVDAVGWSRTTITSGTSRYWRFETFQETDEVVILATWPRVVSANFASWSMMNIDLRLHRVEGTTLLPLSGDDGLPYFDSGTVVSESDVDNVELLVVRGLEPGEYVFEIFRNVGATSTSVAVAWIMPETTPPAPIGDLNGDGIIDGADLGLLLIDWGRPGPGDLNGDGIVNGVDLGLLLQNWG